MALEMGISKREFMEDYYLDEFMAIVEQHSKSSAKTDEEVFIDQLGF